MLNEGASSDNSEHDSDGSDMNDNCDEHENDLDEGLMKPG